MSFNSQEYAWKDLTVVIGGRPITGITEIEYGVERKVDDIYASGTKPHSRVKGNKKYSGSITVLQSEYEALQLAAKTKYGIGADITDLDFNITVAYVPKVNDVPEIGAIMVIDTLKNCCIPSLVKKIGQDSTGMSITLPLMIADIDFQA